MFCPNCGHQLNEDEKFCPNCGVQIEDGKIVSTCSSERKQNQKDNEIGIIALTCGILSLILSFFGLILGILACVFSSKVKDHTSMYAKAGKVTGIIGIIFSLIKIAFFIYLMSCSITIRIYDASYIVYLLSI